MTKENLYNAKEAAVVYRCAKDKREAMKERRKELLEELGAIDRCLQAVAAAAAEGDE